MKAKGSVCFIRGEALLQTLGTIPVRHIPVFSYSLSDIMWSTPVLIFTSACYNVL